jgi:NhaA family Na+:H+ antiporter
MAASLRTEPSVPAQRASPTQPLLVTLSAPKSKTIEPSPLMAPPPPDQVELPREPIDALVAPFDRFMHVEASSGFVLLAATFAALLLANSPWSEGYLAIWSTSVGFVFGSFEMRHSLQHWINDGLMVVFFFVIGLEVKRELVIGELRDLRVAVLPVSAALGGMVAPAALYLAFQYGEPGQNGWGIPMATDIAFVVGCLALLGPRVPSGFRVLLLSLAIADDIGAILVIAIGYTETIHVGALAGGVALLLAILAFERLGVRSLGVYAICGVGVWFAFHESGVHATIAGVIIGLMTPARAYLSETTVARSLQRTAEVLHGDGESPANRSARVRHVRQTARETISPLEYLEAMLHPWVSFLIIPLFALANAGVQISSSGFFEPVAIAVAAGLVVGKPLGIVLLSWLAVRLGIATLPEGVGWMAVLGGGLLAGIGFTMALFIAALALEGPTLGAAKVGILAASAVAAILGMAVLVRTLPHAPSAR